MTGNSQTVTHNSSHVDAAKKPLHRPKRCKYALSTYLSTLGLFFQNMTRVRPGY